MSEDVWECGEVSEISGKVSWDSGMCGGEEGMIRGEVEEEWEGGGWEEMKD